MSHESVSQWITQLKAGDISALARLHQRYWPTLCRLATLAFREGPRRVQDEEDAAQEALLGLYNSLRRGGFPNLNDRHDLLAVLSMITARKVANQRQHELRQKRGAGAVRDESALDPHTLGRPVRGIEQVASADPSPEESVILRDLYDTCISVLDERLRPFAKLYLAGLTYREIAQELGCVKRTVERKLPLIREQWRRLLSSWIDAAHA